MMMEEMGGGSMECACPSARERRTIDQYRVGQSSMWPLNDSYGGLAYMCMTDLHKAA